MTTSVERGRQIDWIPSTNVSRQLLAMVFSFGFSWQQAFKRLREANHSPDLAERALFALYPCV
jgi:hypothetical protein